MKPSIFSESEKKAAVLHMWEFGVPVTKLKYNVSYQTLYNWRDKFLADGTFEAPTAQEVALKIRGKNPDAGEILELETKVSSFSPLEFLNEALRTRMAVLRQINQRIPKTTSLRDLNDCLRAINEGIDTVSVGNQLLKVPDRPTMWGATELILKHRKEFQDDIEKAKAIDIPHTEMP